MADRRKRKLEDFDPNKSDSNDSDYDNAAPTSSARARARARPSQSVKSQSRRPQKRKRERYGDSEDDIEPDDDDESDDISEDYNDSDGKEEAHVNPSTGRRQRAAARKAIDYEESSEAEDEIQATSDEDIAPPKTNTRRKPLIVKLKVPSLKMPPHTSRSRAASRRGQTPDVGSTGGTRRSSRVATNSEEPLFQLTDSGKHTTVVRAGSADIEQLPPRATRGSKGVKKLPSAIMEASQEDSGPSGAADEEIPAPFMSQLQEQAAAGESTAKVEDEGDTPMASDTQMEEAEIPGTQVEQAAQQEEEDDEDEEPVFRKPSRSLRVSLVKRQG